MKAVTMVVVLFSFFIAAIMILVIQTEFLKLGEECEFKGVHTLKSFNGIKDDDTGLFASGSTSRNTLMFNNGLIIDYEKIDFEVKIGKEYYLEKCNTPLIEKAYWKVKK